MALLPFVVAAAAINSLMVMGVANYVMGDESGGAVRATSDQAPESDLHIGM